MILETDRLFLMPLDVHKFRLWICDIPALEKVLECKYEGNDMYGIFLELVKKKFEKMSSDEVNYLFHTFWLIIIKNTRIIIGSTDFKDVPNEHGEVEVGYGINSLFENKGYTAEAVTAMCGWALEQADISYVTAETEKGNIASQRVLQKCGMVKTLETQSSYWWAIGK